MFTFYFETIFYNNALFLPYVEYFIYFEKKLINNVC